MAAYVFHQWSNALNGFSCTSKSVLQAKST